MGLQGAAAAVGMLRAMRANADRFSEIKKERAKIKEAEETNALNKKKLNLQIQELEQKNLLTSGQINNIKKVEEAKIKAKQEFLNAENAKIDVASDENKVVARQLNNILRTHTQQFKTDALGRTTEINTYGYKEAPESSSNTIPKADRILGELQVGKRYDQYSGTNIPFQSDKEKEEYAAMNLGYNWKEKYPEAERIIYGKKREQDKKIGRIAEAGINAGMGGQDFVNVVSPDGQQGRIPKSKLDAALEKGFKIYGQ